MSIQAGCARDYYTVGRLVVTQGDAGGQIRTYTSGARGALPTSGYCRLQPTSNEENVQYGIKAPDIGWKMLHSTNPSLTVADAVTFTDEDEELHTDVRVIQPSRNLDNQGRLYRTIIEEKKNRE